MSKPTDNPQTESLPVRDFVVVLTDEEALSRRISFEALAHFVVAVDRELAAFAEDGKEPGVDVQIAWALMPHRNKRLEVETHPPGRELPALQQRLDSLAIPDVLEGPAVFVTRRAIWGGTTTEPAFRAPFRSLFTRPMQPLDEALMVSVGLASKSTSTNARLDQPKPAPSPPWWKKVASRIRARMAALRGSGAERPRANLLPDKRNLGEESSADLPFPPVPPQELSLESLTQLIQQNPDNAVYYGLRGDLCKTTGDWEQAIDDYTQVIRLQPDDAYAYVARGDANCGAGIFEKGLADFSQALERNGQHVDALRARGRVYLELSAWDQAFDDFSKANAVVNGRQPSLRVNLGRALLGKGDSEGTIRECDSALEIDPHNEEAYALRAIARRGLTANPAQRDEQTRGMLQDIDAAISLNPDSARHFICRAEIRLAQGDYAQAAEDCDHALELDAGCSEAYAIRGITVQQLGRFSQAVEDCNKAIEGGLASPEIFLARSAAHQELGQFESAMDDCQQALELDEHHAGAHNSRGLLHLILDAPDEAIEDFNRAIELADDWALPYANRGNAHRARDDWQQAVRDYDRALEIDGELATAFLNRAVTRAEQGDYEQARDDFAEAVLLAPDFAPGFFSRAIFWIERGEYHRALADFDTVIRLDPSCAPAYYNRASLRAQNGDHDAAMADFDTLIQMCPSLGAAYSGRGNVWIQKGEHDKALDDYREAIQCDPGAAEAYMVQRLIVEAAHYHKCEDFQNAIAKANEALEIEPESAPAYSIRAAANWYSEQFVEAIEDYSLLLEQDNDSFAALNGRGQVYAELGEFELAIQDLDRAIEHGAKEETRTNVAYARSGRALAKAGLGRYDEASDDFNASIRDCPENAWVHYNHALTYDHLNQADKALTCFELALELDDPPLTPRKRDRAKAYVDRAR